MIATAHGWRAVETLTTADRVVTRDNGLRRIVWIGRRDVDLSQLTETPELTPILVRRGSLGNDLPARDMWVSPNHRFMIKNPKSPTNDEVLVGAGHMVDLKGIMPVRVLGVSYLHILLETHEVILANGSWTESFHPEDRVIKAMGRRQRNEILTLFPEIATMGAAKRFPAAREIKKSRFDS